jgi:uncharacterized protein YjbJ (UPF0337 family)
VVVPDRFSPDCAYTRPGLGTGMQSDRNNRGETMGAGDKIKNVAKEAKAKVKEKTGDATDNRDLQAEGQGEKSKADLKQAAEKAKDAFKD